MIYNDEREGGRRGQREGRRTCFLEKIEMIKEKHVMHSVSNEDKMKPGTVVKLVQAALGNPKILKGNKHFQRNKHFIGFKLQTV